MRKPLFIGLVFGLLTAAGTAAAQYPLPPPPPPAGGGYYAPPPPVPMQMPQRQHFGDAGQLVVAGDTNFALTGSSYSENGGSSFDLILQPSLDYFVIQNLSLGAVVIIDHASTSSGGASTSSNTYGVFGRVGYNIALGDTFSWWPKLGLGYTGLSSSTTPAGAGAQQTASGGALALQVFAPLLVHPINHSFFGLGPFVQTDLTESASGNGVSVQNPPKLTTYGVMFELGGWMDF
jgi:hypothetical protein